VDTLTLRPKAAASLLETSQCT